MVFPTFDIKKVLISDAIDECCVKLLKDAGMEVKSKQNLKPQELINALQGMDALIVRSATTVSAEVIENATSLKIIGRAGTGVDNIDVKAATKAGILVINTPGGNTISAAEHTMAMLCCMARKIPCAHASFKAGNWDRKRFTGVELEGKTIGILGLGRIGREVAKRCQSFGMKTVGYDPLLPPEMANKFGIEFVSLQELWPRVDFLSVHTPLTDETRGLVSDSTLQQCKPGVRIVNCARGGIIDEGALLRALKSNKCAGAALDVFETEPPTDILNNELLQHPNVIITPHLGASTEEAQSKVAQEIAEQIIYASQGKTFSGVVNAPYLGLSLNPDLAPWLQLAVTLGKLIGQLMFVSNGCGVDTHTKLQSITVSTTGEMLNSSSSLLTCGVMSGLLTRLCSESVNLINSTLIAEQMGISVSSIVSRESSSYSSLLSVDFETPIHKRTIKATIFGKDNPRIVRIDEFYCEIQPEGSILFLQNKDRPGVCAKIGGLIAETGINIGFLSLGRSKESDVALTIIGVDSELPKETLKKIQKIEWVLNAKMVKL